MKLSVKNLGPISFAEIDLSKDLIILTGENNTGKTYLAYTIYALNLLFKKRKGQKNFLRDEVKLKFHDGSLTIDLMTQINSILAIFLKEKLAENFSYSSDFFKNTLITVNLSNHQKEELLGMSYSDIIGNNIRISGGKHIALKVQVQKEKGSPFLIFKTNEKSQQDWNGLTFAYAVYPVLQNIINNWLLKNAFIIPAERQGVNLFHKELALFKNKIFDNILENGRRTELLDFLETRFNKYPSAIKDSLENAQNFDVITKQVSKFAYLANKLEKDFLGGNVLLNKEGDIQFQPNNTEKILEIHMTSSTVKSLSMLSIYLRHLATKGDFIIIDEPELNLHPDNQRKIARFFSLLVKEGFKVMISTHSDYIMRELNTLIMLEEGKKHNPIEAKELMQKYNYQNEALLLKEKVGVYLFKVGKDVEQVKVGELGFQIETIDKQIDEINQASQNILFSLFDY